jgi:hypothetical protein
MKYYIRRNLNEYGPYTLEELQRYVTQGNISLSDLTRGEGRTEWVPVSQVLGNIPATPPAPPYPSPAGGTPSYSGGVAPNSGGAVPNAGTVYRGTPAYSTAGQAQAFVPPDLHWALVLLIGIITCGIFFWVWFIIEAVFVKKIRPQSTGLLIAIVALVCSVAGSYLRFAFLMSSHFGLGPVGSGIGLLTIILVEVAAFSMKSDLEQYYNSAEPINLRLNGVMVFFFAVFYFQHHFTRISRWKKTGILEPQG